MTTSRPIFSATRAAGVGLAIVIGVLSSSACGGPSTTGAPAASTSAPGGTSTSAVSAPTTTGPSTSTSSSPPAGAPAGATLTIKDFMFGVPVSVAPGATVTVSNADPEAHTVTSKDGGFDLKVAGHGGTGTFTAPPAGRYQLSCDFHADMTGVLVVS